MSKIQLQPFNPDKQLIKQRRAEQIFAQWFADWQESKGNYNPFSKFIKELFDKPPFIPQVDLRTAKQRR